MLSQERDRTCGRCHRVLPIEAFNASSEFGRQYWCRDCQKQWYRENRGQHMANVNANTDRYQERNSEFVLRYLQTHPCVDCGESDPLVLEFDHIRDKDKPVSRLKWGSAPLERLMAEIEKCEVRCVNCHMKRTAAQFNWRKARIAQ